MRKAWSAVALSTAAVAVLAVLVAAGTVAEEPAVPRATAEASPTSTPTPTVNPFDADGMQDPAVPAPAVSYGAPVTVRIPRIGVDSTLERLSVGAVGELQTPADFDLAGWYADGPAPGEIGPAIIAGHVDSVTRPAVFARLTELQPGDTVIVDTESGASLTFTVTRRMQSAKATFPTADVYSNVPRPELRLITCGGVFDRSIGHYTDNLIVFASLQEVPE